ncbi:MAG: SpoIIE family protein phosphatase [Lachnospiraceae bacterium]|nr:SpoIIE family protein phosphatase [Lachnospiraceae bacterium]
MDIYSWAIILMAACVFVLEFMKLFMKPPAEQKKRNHTDIGNSMTIGSREIQEDQMDTLETDDGIIAVLADGAGQAFGGRIASRIAVDTCMDIFKDYNAFNNPQYYFRKAFHCANKEILKALGDERRGSASVGCVLIQQGFLYYALVGNIKICVYREGALVPVSSGHTVAVLAEQKFREGIISREDALALLENHRLYNYLGQDEFRDIEYFDAPIRLKREDIVVLMSDGIYDLLGFKEVEEILAKASDCQSKAFDIIELVNGHPAEMKDNASIILLRTGNGAEAS